MLTATKLTKPELWTLEKWGEMGGQSAKMGGNGEKAGITRNVGCVGLWRDVVEENGTKMGEKVGGGGEIPIFQSHFPPFFWRSKIFPTIPCFKNSAHHTHRRKNGNFCRSPPPRLVRMLARWLCLCFVCCLAFDCRFVTLYTQVSSCCHPLCGRGLADAVGQDNPYAHSVGQGNSERWCCCTVSAPWQLLVVKYRCAIPRRDRPNSL